jgi:hypothetical protein
MDFVAYGCSIEKKPYFMGKGLVPNHAHLLVVPNTLVDQVHRKLKTFFQPRSIDIFWVPTIAKKLSPFWNEYNGSKHEPIFRVVIIPHSVSTLQYSVMIILKNPIRFSRL